MSFCNGRLSDSEVNYCVTRKEIAAVIKCLQKWRFFMREENNGEHRS